MCAADTHMVTCTVRTYVCMCVPPFSSISYLELLGLFSKLISVKREEVSAARKRTKTGLDKLLSTGEQVAVLQADLEKMQPELEQAQVCMSCVWGCMCKWCMCVHVCVYMGLLYSCTGRWDDAPSTGMLFPSHSCTSVLSLLSLCALMSSPLLPFLCLLFLPPTVFLSSPFHLLPLLSSLTIPHSLH